MKAFVFPGQGAQFVGMGKDLYENSALAKELFEKANDILGYRITDIMFNGTDEDLRQTKVTQPAVFLHSVISALCMGDDFKPEMTAGHSLGEFSALVAAGALSFEDGLKLVYARAMAMQKACEATPSTMAAVLALPDATVEEICASIKDEVVVCANYNCPGQLVISGSIPGIDQACEKLLAAGANDEEFDGDKLQSNMESKAAYIDELNSLDEGFQAVFDRVKEDVEEYKANYKELIIRLQELIREATSLSATIQAQESRNKVRVDMKFRQLKSEAKTAKRSVSMANRYYQNMSKISSEPQFMDQKK